MDSPIRQQLKRNDYQRHKLFRKMKRRLKAKHEQEKELAEKELRRKLRMPKYADGKSSDENRLTDQLYYAIMEKVAEENNSKWNKLRLEEGGRPLSVNEDYLRILNDNSYDYRGYYNKYPQSAANADTHWPDEFKTVWHPLFSDESIYSGKKSQYNPKGIVGGHWYGDNFVPSVALFIENNVHFNKYADGKEGYPNLKKIVLGDDILPLYERYIKDGMTPEYSLSSMRRFYDMYMRNSDIDYESFYEGELPAVTIKPDYNKKYDVKLVTHYPSLEWPIGHSEILTPGGNIISADFDDRSYNLLLNNCSDATILALSLAFGTKLGWHWINTPGTAKSFAELKLGGKTEKDYPDDVYQYGEGHLKNAMKGADITHIPATMKQLQTLANFAHKLHRTGKYADGKPAYKIRTNDGELHNFSFDKEGNTVLDNGVVGSLLLDDVIVRPGVDVRKAIERRSERLAKQSEMIDIIDPLSKENYGHGSGALESVYPEFDLIGLYWGGRPLILNVVRRRILNKRLNKLIETILKNQQSRLLTTENLSTPDIITVEHSPLDVAQYLEENPVRLERWPASGDVISDGFPKSLYTTGGYNVFNKPSKEAIAAYDMDVANHVVNNLEAYVHDVFKGMPPLSNFLARTKLTLKDALKSRISTELFIDRLLMEGSLDVDGYFTLMKAGIQDAAQAVTGNNRLLGPDDVTDLISRMASGDPEALAIRNEMIKRGGFSAYNPTTRKIHIKSQPNFNTFDGEQLSVADQIAFSHEYGHLLFLKEGTSLKIQLKLEKELGKTFDEIIRDGNGAAISNHIGFDPTKIKDKSTRDYLLNNWFEEIVQRLTQWKDALGFRSASQQLTGDDVRRMMKIYVSKTGQDNNMKEMVAGITDPDKFAKFFSEFAKTAAIPTTIGTATAVGNYRYGKAPGIHIKPENRGKFTALKKRTGHSASWFKAHGTPALKKMATFALNARKWGKK